MTDAKPDRPSYLKARVNVTIRLRPSALESIDSLRGGWSRSEYVRQAIADAVKAGKRGPKVADL